MSKNTEIKELKHNLASPVTNIIYSLELLAMEEGKVDLLKNEELQSILYSAEQLRTLIGGREATMADKATFCVVDEIKQLAKAYHKPYKVKVVVSAPDEHVYLCGKKEIFATIMQALMNNAAESYPDNQGERKIFVSLATLNDRITIFVSDNGRGMSPLTNLLSRMRYFSNKAHKSGLGIPGVIDNLAKEFQGKLSCDTKKGIGTTMMVEIPMKM